MEPTPNHAVRISRVGVSDPARRVPLAPTPRAISDPRTARDHTVLNRAGTRRARRLTIVYLLVLAAIFAVLESLSRLAPAAGSVGVAQDSEWIDGIAIVLAVVGAVVCMTAAPSAVERTGTETIVHGWFGYRRRFKEGPGFSLRVIRSFPSGWLSAVPVESVEIASGGVRRRYLLEEGLLSEPSIGSPGT